MSHTSSAGDYKPIRGGVHGLCGKGIELEVDCMQSIYLTIYITSPLYYPEHFYNIFREASVKEIKPTDSNL